MAFRKNTNTISRRRVTPARTQTFAPEDMGYIDYKDVKLLRRFVSRYMKIESRKRTGASAKYQRAINTAIKRARHLALLPFKLS
ncbi:MAG: 30S ribosomal protein S18 [Patescibacteria group bacterium]